MGLLYFRVVPGDLFMMGDEVALLFGGSCGTGGGGCVTRFAVESLPGVLPSMDMPSTVALVVSTRGEFEAT